MAILKDVEVRVVSKTTGLPLAEYAKPGMIMGSNTSVERYIEAKTGEDFQIEVFIKRSFKYSKAWGLKIAIDIDGGVVSFTGFKSKVSAANLQATGRPVVVESVPHLRGGHWSNVGFRFGSLSTNEDIDLPREELENQAKSLGLIKVYVESVNRKKLRKPITWGNAYTPSTTLEVSKELLKEKHISNVMRPGEITAIQDRGLQKHEYDTFMGKGSGRTNFWFRYRSEMRLQLLGCLPRKPALDIPVSIEDDVSVVPVRRAEKRKALKLNPPAVKEGPSLSIPKTRTLRRMQAELEGKADHNRVAMMAEATAYENQDGLAEEVRQLKQQLKENQERQASMMQMFMGGFGSPMHPALGTPNVPTPAAASSSLQQVTAKREHVKQEDDNKTSGQVPRPASRPAKRAKVVIELD